MSSRRSFLKFFAVSTSCLGTFEVTKASETSQFEPSYDLIVVGAGGAGLSAAGHAASLGKKVLVLEKMSFPGGSSMISGGQWAASGTDYQRKHNVSDSEKLFFDDMMAVGGNLAEPSLVKMYIEASNKEHEWFAKESGVKPIKLMVTAGQSVPRGHKYDAAKVTGFYLDYAKRNGAVILTNMNVRHLLKDTKDVVVGVEVLNKDGQVKKFYSKTGVLLATGGFARSPELLAKYSPKSRKAQSISGSGATGDGIKMAQEFGGDVADVAYVKPTYGFILNPKHAQDMTTVYYQGAIIVNKEGKRFTREDDSYKNIGEAALAQKDAASFLVMDERIRKAAVQKDPRNPRILGQKGKTDFGFTGNTIEEAATRAGIPPATLRKTIDEYNANAPKGTDPLGRKSLTSGFGKPLPLQEGPFVIIPATACILSTYCGLRVNDKLNVLNVYGKPIKGLYAAGEVCGGFHGSSSMSGTGFSKAFALGRIAAENMANNLN